jgi:hypothetical protein
MAANSKKNIAIGTQWGEGQLSLDTLLPISASSITQPAEAGSNVEAEDIPLSMTGATGAPAPNGSAVSQIQIPGMNDGRKGIGEMKPETQNGGDPPVVGRKPTGSDSAAQLFLHRQEWSEEDSLKVAIDLTSISASSVRYFEMGQDNAFHIGHVTKHDEDGFYLYTESQSHLSINGEPITGDPAKISGVLANYQFGGMTAVLAYLDSIKSDHLDEEPEGSQSLQANSPEHLKVNSPTENGDEVE